MNLLVVVVVVALVLVHVLLLVLLFVSRPIVSKSCLYISGCRSDNRHNNNAIPLLFMNAVVLY